jgi:hypothetical protein
MAGRGGAHAWVDADEQHPDTGTDPVAKAQL